MKDFANIIASLLIDYLPNVNPDYGQKALVKDININGNKVILTFEPQDYQVLLQIINNPTIPNNIFTIYNICIKNQITEFKKRSDYNFEVFEVKFEFPVRFKTNDIITLSGFANPIYNQNYKVLTNRQVVILKPINSININDVPTGLGYCSLAYNNGFNGFHSFTNEGNNQLSYIVDTALFNMIDDINKIDKEKDIYLYNLLNNIKVMDYDVFKQANSEINEEFLIVDTASFNGSPAKNNINNTDKSYILDGGAIGKIDRIYTARILYYLVRNENDSFNQTDTGGDIFQKQIEMYFALTKILLNFDYKDDDVAITPIVIIRDGVAEKVESGSVVLQYDLEFSVCYNLTNLILPLDSKVAKLIKRLQFNNQISLLNE